MKLTIQHYFDAAHQLEDSPELITKACARLHGHTYAIKLTIGGELNNAGMVIDFRAIKDVIDQLDHQYINEIFEKKSIELQPTAENIAIIISEWVQELGVKVYEVAVCEGYKGAEKASWAVYEV